ncbi:MAG: LSU ribosomal protein L18p (L5e) [Ignavibacteriae bacterium]|nr:MAG: LSU ribosomal protein L18p (L5e) [Ignavibacteriota bacterium]
MINKSKFKKRDRIKKHIRKKIFGTPERPRLSVYRSLKHIYAQIIDDTKGHTLAFASTKSKDLKDELSGVKSKIEKAKIVGKHLAELALKKNITKVVFDRSGYRYHGKVKAIAEGAREGGLQF